MTVVTRPASASCADLRAQGELHPTNQLQPVVSALALQFSESLELPVVLELVAGNLASLFEGLCRVQFTPAQRPADARCVVAIPNSPASLCAATATPAPYTELLARLEQYWRVQEPTLVAEPAEEERSALRGEGNPTSDSGAELLLAPLLARGRRIGRLDVVIPAHQGLNLRRDQGLLRELAAHAALAIDTADYVAQHRPPAETESGTTAGREVAPLLALLAHDLRAPLATLSTSMQMLVREVKGAREPSAERLAHLIEVAEASLSQLETQVSALTPAHRVGSPLSGCLEEVDLVRLTRLMANFYQQTTGRHQLAVSADVPELFGPWARAHLERVLGNLMLNAIKYSPEGGDIGIGVGHDEDGLGRWATLSVQNRGPGIPLQDLHGISQPGYRARNVGAIPGTGFGLASVREVVEQQGGSFAIRSEVGGSTTVLVRLPL